MDWLEELRLEVANHNFHDYSGSQISDLIDEIDKLREFLGEEGCREYDLAVAYGYV